MTQLMISSICYRISARPGRRWLKILISSGPAQRTLMQRVKDPAQVTQRWSPRALSSARYVLSQLQRVVVPICITAAEQFLSSWVRARHKASFCWDKSTSRIPIQYLALFTGSWWSATTIWTTLQSAWHVVRLTARNTSNTSHTYGHCPSCLCCRVSSAQ